MPNPGFTHAQTGPLNVLAIHEMLPHPDRHGADLQWVQMLEEFRAQGHQITHIARSGVNRAHYAPPLEALGIKVLTPDAERLHFLGFDLASDWSLEDLLTTNNFDLAILFHWFWNGISIPEHYLEDIRRLSPDTFIAVLTDDQQGLRELQAAKLANYWADFERSHNFSAREMEVYRRADVVLTISEDDRRAFLRTDPTLRTGPMPGKHPALLGDGSSLFGMLDQAAAKSWQTLIATHREEIEATVKQLERIDAFDFAPFLTMSAGERSTADEITALFRRAVPDVYWHYFFSSLLDAWNREPTDRSVRASRAAAAPGEAFL